ncbi:MAG: copper homeostasis protein CutC [Flavobacteriaceae bacterium]
MIVEICANSLQSAINAEKAGADRLELCSELGVGGITPSYGLLKSIKRVITIPVHVLIRPRSGDFTYSEYDFEIMKEDIQKCAEMGFEGIVSGVLLEDLTLDQQRTEELVALSEEMTFTFHRAFDWVKDPRLTFRQLQDMGVDYVLSSGQQNTAIEGLQILKELLQLAKSCKPMPGGGINATNAQTFLESNFDAIHLSGTQFHRTLSAVPKVSMNSAAFLKEDQLAISSIERVEKVIKIVK